MAHRGFKVVVRSQFAVEEVPATHNYFDSIMGALDHAIPLKSHDSAEAIPHKKAKHPLILLIEPIAVLFILIVWALCGAFLSRYQIGNTKVSLLSSRGTLRQVVSAQTKDYKIAVTYPDKTIKTYSLQDMGMQTDVEATVNSMRQFHFTNFLRWWQPKPAKLVYKVDQKAFNDFLAKLTITVQPAEDARISIDNGNIVVTGSTTGKRYGLPNPQANIESTAGSLKTAPLNLELLSVNPSINTAQLTSSKTKLTQVLGQKIEFTISGTTVSPSAADMGSWLDLSSDKKTKTVNIAVNSGKVLEYINNVAARYIRPARDQLVITRSDGTSSVMVQGVNGIDVLNKSDIATNVSNALMEAKGMKIDLPVQSSPFKTVTAGEYDRWLEVDLTNKKMYAYEKNTLVRTFLVSAGAPATPTVVGQYKIYAKYTQQDMSGNNVDGSTYFQPHVPWVNYFTGGYAIHGNYWRPLSWFGNINSSHGCVGIIPSDGEWIYNWAPIGTTVITHN